MPTKTRPSRTGKHHGPEGRTDEQSPKYACPGAGTSLLKSTKSLLYVSGCWLAAGCCTAAVALTAASACVCCCLLMPAAACCCLRLPAACCCLLLPAAACCWCCCWWLLLLLWCCCCAAAIKQHGCCCCCSSPKQESKVLFPGALPLASAGVGGFKDQTWNCNNWHIVVICRNANIGLINPNPPLVGRGVPSG